MTSEWHHALWARWQRSYGVEEGAAGAPELRQVQRDAAAAACSRIQAWNVCVLADPVGSGKSYVALGVARLLAPQCSQSSPSSQVGVTVVCPRPLVAQWEELLQRFAISGSVCSDGVLSRRSVGWAEGGLVVVDEAHRYRNAGTARHRNLLASLGGRPVLLLTATPVWNRRSDLVNIVGLGLNDAGFRWVTGEGLERLRGLVDEETAWGAVAYDALWEGLVVRSQSGTSRSRREVVARPRLVDAAGWERVRRGASAAMFGLVEPSELFVRVVARRLASSPAAALSTLRRGLAFLDISEEAARAGRSLSRAEARRVLGSMSAELRGSGVQGVLPFWFHVEPLSAPVDFAALRSELQGAIALLEDMERAGSAKIERLHKFIRARRKTVVFSEYGDTARAIVAAAAPAHRWALVSAKGCALSGIGRVSAEFAWKVFRDGFPFSGLRCDYLVTTPMGSEGLNLQGAEGVVHYDLPWNPARMEQRVGRVDRLGGIGAVHVLRFEPQAELEAAFEGRAVLRRKEKLIAAPVCGDGTSSVESGCQGTCGAGGGAAALIVRDAAGPFGVVALAGVGESFAMMRVGGAWRRCAAASVLRCVAVDAAVDATRQRRRFADARGGAGDTLGHGAGDAALRGAGPAGLAVALGSSPVSVGLPAWCHPLVRPLWLEAPGAAGKGEALRVGAALEAAGMLEHGGRAVGAGLPAEVLGGWVTALSVWPSWDASTIPTWTLSGTRPSTAGEEA